jgi:hypothetical protein
VPETREVSTKNVLLVIDSYLPRGRMLDDAVGVEEVLDKLVETWISLAKELVSRGDRVTLACVARDAKGAVGIEVHPAQKGGHVRWQDLGARVLWQGGHELGDLLKEAGGQTHGVIVSSRFQSPPPEPFDGESLTWVYLQPEKALGERDPSLLEALAGSPINAFLWLFRLPFPVGSDENAFFAQLGIFRQQAMRLGARRRLRLVAKRDGRRIFSQLVQRGAGVTVVMSRSAAQFIGPLTFQTITRRRVMSEQFDLESVVDPTHISLTDKADLMAVAPATANFLAKAAYGIADDMLTSLLLAVACPVLVAPAMNDRMWKHPAVRGNVAILKKRGVRFVEPENGFLACGTYAVGRLAEAARIVAEIETCISL